MSTLILESIERICSKRPSETIEGKRTLSLEFSKQLLDLDGTNFLNTVTSLTSDEERSNKFIYTLAQALILCKGDTCDKRLALVDRLLAENGSSADNILSPVLSILLWIYLTRAFCTASSIPNCHFSSDDIDKAASRPEYDGVEQTLLRICSKYTDLLSPESYSLCLHEDDLNSSSILGTNKLKLYKQCKVVNNNKFIKLFENVDENGNFNFPTSYKDQTYLVQICILIIHISSSNNALTHIWILLGLCESLSNQELIPIDLSSIDFEAKSISENGSKIRINLEDNTLILLCKTVGWCLFALNSKKQKANVKRVIYEKIKNTLIKLQKRSICEILPYPSSFISSYLVLVERMMNS